MSVAEPGGGILIVRVHHAPDGSCRIRLTRVVDREERPVVTVGDVDEACRAVREWLDDTTGTGPPPRPRAVR
jgi:hypothetical protein